MFDNFEFVLLSNSPRRAQLIKEMGVKFSVIKRLMQQIRIAVVSVFCGLYRPSIGPL